MAKKGAFASGGGKGRRRQKDQAMAAELKLKGVNRVSGRCPICNQIISLNHFYNHVATHK